MPVGILSSGNLMFVPAAEILLFSFQVAEDEAN